MELSLVRAFESDWVWLFGVHVDCRAATLELFDVELERLAFVHLLVSSVVYVVVEGQVPVGALFLSEDEDDLCVSLLEVVPASQGRGVGSWVVSEVLALGRSLGRGVSCRTGEVSARRFFSRRGLVPLVSDPSRLRADPALMLVGVSA